MATLKSIKNKYLSASDGDTLGVGTNTDNVSLLSLKLATADSLAKFNMVDGASDDYNDATGVTAPLSPLAVRSPSNYYYGDSPSAARTSFTSTPGPAAFAVPAGSSTIDVLVVGGGGCGGRQHAGGGGAGGVIYRPAAPVTASGTIPISIGAGGTNNYTGGTVPGASTSYTAGQDTTWGPGPGQGTALVAKGGGHGGGWPGQGGTAGGSGGGGAGPGGGGGAATQPGMPGDSGSPYGRGHTGATGPWAGGGGGGAGSAGASAGDGGYGYATSIADGTTSVYYGGGGGGGGHPSDGSPGGQGGGGHGDPAPGPSPHTGVANTGGGGGGGNSNANQSGFGASGIVVIYYSQGNTANFQLESANYTAATQPDNVRIVFDEYTASGSSTIGTDVKAWASRDGGTTFTEFTNLASQGTIESNHRLVTGSVDISGQPAGTNMRYRIITYNTKDIRIYGTSLTWS